VCELLVLADWLGGGGRHVATGEEPEMPGVGKAGGQACVELVSRNQGQPGCL